MLISSSSFCSGLPYPAPGLKLPGVWLADDVERVEGERMVFWLWSTEPELEREKGGAELDEESEGAE
jgi:hypothetical protein